MKRGHIPGSLNLPWDSLVTEGKLKSEQELLALVNAAGIDLQKPVMANCGSGVTAVVIIAALRQLGHHEVTLYDGSWGKWGSRGDLPVICQ